MNMKKLFVLVTVVIFAFNMNAQNFGIGVRAGYESSSYIRNFKKLDGSKFAKGYNLGIVGELNFGGINGRLDLDLIQLGSDFYNEVEINGIEYISDHQTDVNYFQICVAAKKEWGAAYAFGGPYVGFALKNVTNGEMIYGDSIGVIEDYDNFKNIDGSDNDFYNKLDFGFYCGAGLNIKGVFVELNGGLGLMNFLNENSDTYLDYVDRAMEINDDGLDARDENFRYTMGSRAVENPSQFNLFFGISAGYLFGF